MWIPVHFRTEPPPVECAGPKLIAIWTRYAGKPVLVEHMKKETVRVVNPPNKRCDCEHFFKLKDHYTFGDNQAVVCANCLEMD